MRLQGLEPFLKECSLSENLFEISGLICLGSMYPNNITDTFLGGIFLSVAGIPGQVGSS